jgi:phosphoribosylformimino-5-aminoimidazole carboxamide ribotide isomerase
VSFDILAAIDLRGGKVVRLRQGDFAREDVFSDDPIEVGERFVDAGVRWLHVVDLDGARTGAPHHGTVIGTLLARLGARVAIEVGGGVRDEARARELLDAGARRIVLGTAALSGPALTREIVVTHGVDSVAVAIDVRAGRAYGQAWGADAMGPPVDAAIERLASAGVRTFEVTAIERDGSLEGPDLELLAQAIRLGAGDIIASGGIRSMADLEAVKGLGCRGAIVGRAIYEGRIALGDLGELARDAPAQEDATDPGFWRVDGVTMNEPTG